jgi:hypothetical protein
MTRTRAEPQPIAASSAASAQGGPGARESAGASAVDLNRLVGEVVYLYAFDVAYEMTRRPVPTLLGQPVADFAIGSSKRSPRQAFFYRAQMIRLPPLERLTGRGPVRLERSVKLLPVGAISITVRVPFLVSRLQELIDFHDLRFADGASVYDEARLLAEEARRELAPYVVRPVEQLRDEEAYTVFCLNSPASSPEGVPLRCDAWLEQHRREVAALLTEEPDPDRLSDQEAEESTSKSLSYYERDVVVMDWDAALVIDDPRFYDETLYLMELANVQLAELEAYDRILDGAVERAYRDVAARRWKGWQAAAGQRELREIRIDMARLSDELSNITKFFGDWHLARIYQGLAARFHLGDWHRTIDDKLKTLDDLYQLLNAERNNRWMLTLEVAIVVLFVIDLLVLALRLR